jgi:secondary thiamine-phosphate synthase enzyme
MNTSVGAMTAATTPEFRVAQHQLVLETRGAREMHDLTDDVGAFVAGTGIATGIVIAYALHTTAGLVVNEWETGFRGDFSESAERLAPSTGTYRHDDSSVRWENLCPEDLEFPNGHAHVQHTLLATPSLTLGIAAGELRLGTWQRILLVEFDRARTRSVALQAIGAQA